MHILFLTDNFPPEGNAPASRTYEHAVEWVKGGCKVTVVTGVPNFPEGEVFEGYENKWYQTEVVDGINVVRVKTYITANEGFLKRILDFLSFMITGFFASLFVRKVDVVVATSPQFFTACAGCMISFFKRVPFVFELRDIWPASITAVGAMKKTWLIQALECLEIFLYRRANMIISVTQSFKRELIQRGIDGDKIKVVLNGVNLSFFSPAERKDPALSRSHDLADKLVVGYIGTHGLAHSLDTVLDAASMLLNEKGVRFLFVGGGSYKNELDYQIAQRNLTNVISLPRQNKEDMPKIWSLVDVSLVTLRDADLFKTVIPSKIFESMGMGLPMLFSGPVGEASEIIESSRSGVCVSAESAQEQTSAIKGFLDNKQRLEGLKCASLESASNYDRSMLAKKMLGHLKGLCPTRGDSHS